MTSPKKRKSTVDLAVSCASPVGSCESLVYLNDNRDSNLCQPSEVTEINSKFNPKKTNNLILSESYLRIYNNKNYIDSDGVIYTNRDSDVFYNKYLNTSKCSSLLLFAHEIDNGVVSPVGKLHFAHFCRDRLCPMCSWRRSYKIFGQVSQIMERINGNYKFLFLTLTVPNVNANQLASALDHLLSSWNRFTGYKKIKKITKGYFRALEVTYNKEKDSFHPHFHVVLAVPLGYFSHSDYLKRDEFLALWQKACRDNSITQVDVRFCKEKYSNDELKAQNYLSSAVAEIAKYAVKDSDYLYPEDEKLTDYLVETFSKALNHRRLVQFGGVFKETFKALKLEDAESDNADLIHVNEKLNPALAWLICRYGWSMGAYKLIGSFVESSDRHNI